MIVYDFRNLTRVEAIKHLDDIIALREKSGDWGFSTLMTPTQFMDLDKLCSPYPSREFSPRISSPVMRTLYYKGHYLAIILMGMDKEPTCSKCSDKPYSLIRNRDGHGILPSENITFLCEHHHNMRALILELKKSH